MKVYGVIFSPFVQRVLMAARAKGHELALDSLPGGAITSPEFAAISPMGRIPLLEDGDLHVCESMVIVAHLDETLPGSALLPADAAGRARARSIAQIADGEFAAALRPFVVRTIFAGPAVPPLLDAARAQAMRGLDAIERLLDADGPWAAGAAVTVADIALVPLLVLAGVLETMPGVTPFVGERPRLRAYRERVFSEPLPLRTKGEMEEGFGRMIAARRQQAAQQQ